MCRPLTERLSFVCFFFTRTGYRQRFLCPSILFVLLDADLWYSCPLDPRGRRNMALLLQATTVRHREPRQLSIWHAHTAGLVILWNPLLIALPSSQYSQSRPCLDLPSKWAYNFGIRSPCGWESHTIYQGKLRRLWKNPCAVKFVIQLTKTK